LLDAHIHSAAGKDEMNEFRFPFHSFEHVEANNPVISVPVGAGDAAGGNAVLVQACAEIGNIVFRYEPFLGVVELVGAVD
jgi:hypothetical protein